MAEKKTTKKETDTKAAPKTSAKPKGGRAEMTKLGRFVTAKGIAAYAYINKPDTQFTPTYKISAIFDPKDPEFKKMKDTLAGFIKKYTEETGKKVNQEVFKVTDEAMSDKFGVKVGTPYLTFKTSATEDGRSPDVYDASAQKVEPNIWGGDTVRVSASVSGYSLRGDCGLKLYLNSVQLLKSNNTGGGSPFSVEQEFLSDNVVTPEADIADEALQEEGSEVTADEEDDTLDDLL